MGSSLRVLTNTVGAVVRFLVKFLMFFGLLPMLLYVIFGLVLYAVFRFNPFDGTLESKLYLAGFAVTVCCAVVILGKNLLVRPVKNFIRGYKDPLWQRSAAETSAPPAPVEPSKPRKWASKPNKEAPKRTKKESPPVHTKRERAPHTPYPNEVFAQSAAMSPMPERPIKYFSKVDPDALIHEYADRFEVYRFVDGRPVRDKVEYKY